MITEKDMRRLRRSASRRNRAVLIVGLSLMSLVLGVCGTLNLIRAHRYAQACGTTLAGLIRDDTAGFDIDRVYPGTYVRALDRYAGGMLELAVVLCLVVQAVCSWALLNRNARILNALESHKDTDHVTAGDGSNHAAPEK